MRNNLPTAYEIAEDERVKQLENYKKPPFDMESGDPDGLYAFETDENTAQLMPGPEFNTKLYRGQSFIYNPCRPSLYRGDPGPTERIINEMRFLQYKENIKALPNVVQFSNAYFFNYRFSVDYQGLAQHYGLNTALLDFSSDPFVAAFFATTQFSHEENKYLPISKEGAKGIFYCFDLKKAGGFNSSQAEIIGAQPFQRPMKQKAFSVKIQEGGCLHLNPNVMYREFRHDRGASQKIYERFEGGEALIPRDPIADMVEKIKAQNYFSDDLFVAAVKNLKIEKNREELKKEILEKGVNVLKTSENYSFSAEEKFLIDNVWEEIKTDINKRLYVRFVLQRVSSTSE